LAVFTPVSDREAEAFLSDYDLGDLVGLHPIAEGVENTNYRLETVGARHVLTLFEARTDAGSLPFCLGLTDHLADRGYPAPRPVRRGDGDWVGTLNGRPAAVIEWLDGAWLRDPEAVEVEAAGAMLARLHVAAAGFLVQRDNPVGPTAWRALADRCATAATGEDRAILDEVEATLARLGDPWSDGLPTGPIHADYFPDNVLFEDGAVSGVIDFYFGCTGALAYDLAIALNAWCFEADASFNMTKGQALLAGYEEVRPLDAAEVAALPVLARGAALRFLLTRTLDLLDVPAGALVKPHDPMPYDRRLAFHRKIAHAAEYGLVR
jgi:homoserine kinase type II